MTADHEGRVQEPDLRDEQVAELLRAARAAAARAYVPYSHFPVGAAVLTADGTIVTGCNIENASFGLTVCAERTAVLAAVAAGHREIVAVAVSAPKAAGTTPCGACRQVLHEFVGPDRALWVIVDQDDAPTIVSLAALLPGAFGPRDLERMIRADSDTD